MLGWRGVFKWYMYHTCMPCMNRASYRASYRWGSNGFPQNSQTLLSVTIKVTGTFKNIIGYMLQKPTRSILRAYILNYLWKLGHTYIHPDPLNNI